VVAAAAESGEAVRVLCSPGDVLMINTRLWRHCTELPSTRMAADRLSISYARDFDLAAESGPAVADDGPADMTNVDGMFATQARRQPPRT
jgi:hypothetical protein